MKLIVNIYESDQFIVDTMELYDIFGMCNAFMPLKRPILNIKTIDKWLDHVGENGCEAYYDMDSREIYINSMMCDESYESIMHEWAHAYQHDWNYDFTTDDTIVYNERYCEIHARHIANALYNYGPPMSLEESNVEIFRYQSDEEDTKLEQFLSSWQFNQ